MRLGDARSLIACLLPLVACSPTPRSSARPDAEFLVVSDDSTAWVHSSADTVVVQRAPLLLTTLGDRLVEVYVAEEAMNFDDGSFLVSRVYRRDLASGDSTLVFADSTVQPSETLCRRNLLISSRIAIAASTVGLAPFR